MKKFTKSKNTGLQLFLKDFRIQICLQSRFFSNNIEWVLFFLTFGQLFGKFDNSFSLFQKHMSILNCTFTILMLRYSNVNNIIIAFVEHEEKLYDI